MTSRERFEAWYLENWGHTEDDHETLFERDPDSDEEYYRLGVRMAHGAWQAAETELAVQLANAESKCRELAARAFNPAILDVIAERHRQQSVEGWTPEHDNAYQNSELADAAACYAIHAHNQGFSTPAHWPWSPDWWKQSGARRDLVKAGALILAEIERIDRADGIGVKGE